MIQENYPVWRLSRETRQKLRAAGIKATDLAAWISSERDCVEMVGPEPAKIDIMDALRSTVKENW